jgi:hypothetical protein
VSGKVWRLTGKFFDRQTFAECGYFLGPSICGFWAVTKITNSVFRRDVDENGALLRYYAASCGNCLPTFRDNISVPFFFGLLTFEDGTVTSSLRVAE